MREFTVNNFEKRETNLGSVGKRIKSRRTQLGLQAQFVARSIGVPLSTYSGWENDRQIRDNTQLVKLSEILSISLSEILTGEKMDRMSGIDQDLQIIEQAIARIRQKL